MLLSRLFFYEKFRSLNNYALICRLNGEKHKKKHTMNNFFLKPSAYFFTYLIVYGFSSVPFPPAYKAFLSIYTTG